MRGRKDPWITNLWLGRIRLVNRRINPCKRLSWKEFAEEKSAIQALRKSEPKPPRHKLCTTNNFFFPIFWLWFTREDHFLTSKSSAGQNTSYFILLWSDSFLKKDLMVTSLCWRMGVFQCICFPLQAWWKLWAKRRDVFTTLCHVHALSGFLS